MANMIQIPGNIKQQFLPFVLNPSSKLHSTYSASTGLKGEIAPQFFTYRRTPGNFSSGKADLQFYPSSLKDIHINDDISYKLLYGIDKQNKLTNESLTIQNVLDHIPGVQIREFLPDTRLDQCINMIVDFFSNMTKLFSGEKKEGDKEKKSDTSIAELCKKITAAAWYTIKYFTGMTDPDFYDDLVVSNGLPFTSYKSDIWQSTPSGNKRAPGYYVMTFPYQLYYRLQSCVTTNIYELPAIDNDKRVITSEGGMSGWTSGGDDFMSAGGFRVSKLLSKIPVIGSLANMILGNIGINYMPWWNAEAGSKTTEPVINMKFDLFNDSFDAAMWNFIFVNTIVPNNKWIQYNMFQHSSCLYDVKIEGLNRLYACAGQFNVTYDGVLRDPPHEFVKALVADHANKNMSGAFMENILNNKLIKIPDVYHVTMTFQSLLPANFNNFLFNYSENAGHLVNYSEHVYDQSVIAEALPNAISKYGKRIAAFWEASPSDTAEQKANQATWTDAEKAEADKAAKEQAQTKAQEQSTQTQK